MQRDIVKGIIEKSLAQTSELFLIDLKINSGNQILVTIDGDRSVSLEDCAAISRSVESKLDREEEDFSIQVTSYGVTEPLKFSRQYKKNIGRKLKIKTKDSKKYKAKLTGADEDGIIIEWKQREPKPVGKGKHTVQKNLKLKYDEIKKAKVMITFN